MATPQAFTSFIAAAQHIMTVANCPRHCFESQTLEDQVEVVAMLALCNDPVIRGMYLAWLNADREEIRSFAVYEIIGGGECSLGYIFTSYQIAAPHDLIHAVAIPE